MSSAGTTQKLHAIATPATDVDDGEVCLTSPYFDFSSGGTIAYDYYLFLTDEIDGVDRLLVEIESPGPGNWIEVARHDTHGGLLWRHHEIPDSLVVARGGMLLPNMRIRFTVNDADPQSIVEAGIDAFVVEYYECEQLSCCGRFTGGFTGNTNCDIEGKRNLSDITRLIDNIYISHIPLCCRENGNTNGDAEGKVNLSDVTRLIDHVYLSHDETSTCP